MHVQNKKYRNFVSIFRLTGKCATQKLNLHSSGLWTCLWSYLKAIAKKDCCMLLAWLCRFNRKEPRQLRRFKSTYRSDPKSIYCYISAHKPLQRRNILHKPWRPKGYFQFEIIINVLVSSFRFIGIPMLWVYSRYEYFLLFSSLYVRICLQTSDSDV